MENEDQKRVTIRKKRPGFATREQRAGFGLLIGIGSLAVILGLFYMVRHLNAPFDLDYVGPRYVSSEEQRQQEIERMKKTDTDGDRLTDYEELTMYKTSRYLSDSDGDGISDSDEVNAGTDPLCPEEEDCYTVNTRENGAAGLVEALEDTSLTSSQQLEQLQSSLFDLEAAQIRNLLIRSGADEEELDELSDTELRQKYQEVLTELEQSGQLDDLLEQSLEDQQTSDSTNEEESDLEQETEPTQ